MKKVIAILLILVAMAAAEGFKRHALTLSVGSPGLILPELAYEFSFDKSNKVAVAAGTFFFVPEYRLSYIRMLNSFEVAGSIGYVPSLEEDDDSFFDVFFEELFSYGTEGTTFISVTGGYRYTADGGFIFRIAGGGGYFVGSDKSGVLPFVQLGVGYGF